MPRHVRLGNALLDAAVDEPGSPAIEERLSLDVKCTLAVKRVDLSLIVSHGATRALPIPQLMNQAR